MIFCKIFHKAVTDLPLSASGSVEANTREGGDCYGKVVQILWSIGIRQILLTQLG